MIKLLVVCLCIYGTVSTPLEKYEIVDDVENEAEIIEATQRLKGTDNLQEKSVPAIRLTVPTDDLRLHGNRNLAERSQIPYNSAPTQLPGIRNLNEKAIPELLIARMSPRHPKSEVVLI